MCTRLARCLLVVAATTFLAGAARAVPLNYFFTAGTVTISATTGSTNLATVTVPLSGNYVTFDATPTLEELNDINFLIQNQGPISLSQPYDGYNSVTIDVANLTPAGGYDGTNVTFQAIGNYSFAVGPVNVVGLISATGTNVAPIVSSPFGFTNNSLTGTLFLNTITGNIALLGVTIGVIPQGTNSTEPFPLVLTGDFHFRGVVPEPGTAILMAGGLLGLVAWGRRAASSR